MLIVMHRLCQSVETEYAAADGIDAAVVDERSLNFKALN
jgi:hypothetical protein